MRKPFTNGEARQFLGLGKTASTLEIQDFPQMRFENSGEYESVVQRIDRIALQRVSQRRL